MYKEGIWGDPWDVGFGFQGSWGQRESYEVLDSLRSGLQGIWNPGHALVQRWGSWGTEVRGLGDQPLLF